MKETVSTIKEEKKTPLKRPTTAVTKILINEEVGLVKKVWFYLVSKCKTSNI